MLIISLFYDLDKLELLPDGAQSTLHREWPQKKTGQPDLESSCPGGKPKSAVVYKFDLNSHYTAGTHLGDDNWMSVHTF
jgi:hypothetical protein